MHKCTAHSWENLVISEHLIYIYIYIYVQIRKSLLNTAVYCVFGEGVCHQSVFHFKIRSNKLTKSVLQKNYPTYCFSFKDYFQLITTVMCLISPLNKQLVWPKCNKKRISTFQTFTSFKYEEYEVNEKFIKTVKSSVLDTNYQIRPSKSTVITDALMFANDQAL